MVPKRYVLLESFITKKLSDAIKLNLQNLKKLRLQRNQSKQRKHHRKRTLQHPSLFLKIENAVQMEHAEIL